MQTRTSRYTPKGLLHGWWLVAACLAIGCVMSPANAQQPNAAKLELRLARLGVVGRVLYIAAHPDDENTGLLAYLANARKLDVGYLSLTRGGGGQNLVGTEQAGRLGILRTQELLQARRIDGAQQFFTRAKDFGYSKSSKETLKFWGRKVVLADVVWVLRSFRPDVVITRFPERGRTHGHHLASAQLARAAFLASGDPKQFPAQLKHVKVWKPKRLIHNVSTWMLRRRGLLKNKKYLAKYTRMDIGGYNPLLGLSYGEISAISRTMHKSQGFGRAHRRGPVYEYFEHLLGPKAKKDLLEGVDVGWRRFPKGNITATHLRAAKKAFRSTSPWRAVPHLLQAHDAMQASSSAPRVKAKGAALVRIVQDCLGLYLDARATGRFAVPGGTLVLKLRGLNRAKGDIKLTSIQVMGQGIAGASQQAFTAKTLAPHTPWRHRVTVKLAPNAPVSAPSWMRQRGTFGTYHIPNPQHVARPFDPAPLYVQFGLQIGAHTLLVKRPIRYVWTDRVRGEQAQRVEVMPPATATPTLAIKMFPNGRSQTLALEVQAYQAKAQGTLTLQVPSGWTVTPAQISVRFAKAQEVQQHRFTVTPPKGARQAAFATPVLEFAGRKYSWKVHFLRYPHVPYTTILEPARIKLVPVVLKPSHGTIGYIEGPGDLVPASLRQIGAKVQIIDHKTLRSGDLSSFHTIITGIRAFNANQTLRLHHKRLHAWVAKGGTLLVQYNTNSRWRPMRLQVGPFPMTIGRARVTDEGAAITPLQPSHPVLQTPHRITANDYKGWVQERGLYFATRWDKRYTPILQMADPGKPPTRGSLLVAPHGKGIFIYTGISFFRQLPAGVPGAYRLLLNLLAHKQKRQEKAKTRQKPKQPPKATKRPAPKRPTSAPTRKP